MKLLYSFTFFLLTCFLSYSSPKKVYKTSYLSYEDLLNKMNTTTKENRDTYAHWLGIYLQKAKTEKNIPHWFDAYNYYVYFEKDPLLKHRYIDSLWTLATQAENKLLKVKALQTQATIYYTEKEYLKSLDHELAALQLIDKTATPYEYHKAMYAIGQTLFYIQDYAEAAPYFTTARRYFETVPDYNHLRGFLNSIRYEALTAYHLKNYTNSMLLTQKGIERLAQVKEDRLPSEHAYFKYIHALNLLESKDYKGSMLLLNQALPEMIKNNDTVNEHKLYYYLGLNHWRANNREEAVSYFKMIDANYQATAYSNLEVKNAYNYLIAHYKEVRDEKQELYYTNQLLKITVFLQNEYRNLNSIIHKELDLGHLEREKYRLEQSLLKKSNVLKGAIGFALLVIAVFTAILIYNQRKKKEFKKRYEEEQERKRTLEQNYFKKQTAEKSASLTVGDKMLKELLHHLDSFEKNEEFLEENINLTDLAEKWHTNRSYLSSCINQYKGKNFVEYVNQLRIAYFLKKVDEDLCRYKSLKIQAIGKELGFSSARSFSNAFVKVLGMPPSFYLNERSSKK